jgi:hypothetical protein
MLAIRDRPGTRSTAQSADRIVWGYAHWIWPVDKVRAIAADTTHPATFFCGGSRNFHKFLDLFDKVFVLDIDVETLNRRLDGRPNEPGFEPVERALVLRCRYFRVRSRPAFSRMTNLASQRPF